MLYKTQQIINNYLIPNRLFDSLIIKIVLVAQLIINQLIMSLNPQKLPNIQPQKQTLIKIKMLKQQVYPKKKLGSKSRSVKIFPSSQIQGLRIRVQNKIKKQSRTKQPVQNQKQDNKQSKLLKTTNLQFHSRKTSCSQIGVPWTVQNWLSGTLLLKKKQIIEKQDIDRPYASYSRSQLSQRKYEPKDGQSLLRKNSLFLLNFITTKERKNHNPPHIGDFPNQISKFQQNQQKYQTSKVSRHERIWRQRNYIEGLKAWKEHRKEEPQIVDYAILPEPW